MIRPITTQELYSMVDSFEQIAWEGWLVGAVIALLLAVLLLAVYQGWVVYLNRDKSVIVFTPALMDTNNYERMEEFFSFIDALLRPKTILGKLQPSRQITLEITTSYDTGLRYQLFTPPHLSAPIVQGIKSIFPGSKVQPVASSDQNSIDGVVRHFKLKNHPALPLRFVTAEHVADPSSFVASSLSELSDKEQAVIQVVLSPTRGLSHVLLHRVNPDSFGKLAGLAEQKLRQPIFKTTLRIKTSEARLHAVTSALYGVNQPKVQQLVTAHLWPLQRSLVEWSLANCTQLFSPSLKLSVGELASLLHPATGRVAKTEDVSTNKSKLLPLPTELKTRTADSGVIIGSAIGSSSNYPIIVTDDDRSRHMYLIGQTGSGKSTILFHMATKDILDGYGVAVIDPHGDLIDDIVSDLVANVGRERANEATQRVVLIDPSDLHFPVGINLLEIPQTSSEEELEQERELVCEGVISVFKRVFGQDEDSNAHRIEYMLRNVIHTAFHVESATIFTLYDLLNDTKYRKQVVKTLTDPNLINFWKNEFHKAGDWQQVKMVSGVTAKIGRFLFSPTVKRILDQPKSTIDFDECLATNKVLLCNLSEGKIGEDNAHLMGSVIITKIHLAALRRSRLNKDSRSPYYLYVDEFQHFATNYFTRLLSGGRKFGLRVIIAQQSTAQIKDKNMLQVILANTGTVVSFRTASSFDADMVLPLFEPMVTREDIVNLPRYNFFIKMGASEPLQAFSGRTKAIEVTQDDKAILQLLELSRGQYAGKHHQATKSTTIPAKPNDNKDTKPMKSLATKLNGST